MLAKHAELDRIRPFTPPIQDRNVSDDDARSDSVRMETCTIEVTLMRAVTGENLTHVTLKMPRHRISILSALIAMGAEFEDRDKGYKYIFCLANGETVICNGNEYNKLAWYVKN